MIGKRERNARPAPRVPLEVLLDTPEVLGCSCHTYPRKNLAYGNLFAALAFMSS